jgi:hypothetical protein
MQRANAIAVDWLVDAPTLGWLSDLVVRGFPPHAATRRAKLAVAVIAAAL